MEGDIALPRSWDTMTMRPGWFLAYQNTEKIDDYIVKIHLKYPSAGFVPALAQGEFQIQANHLSNIDVLSPNFLVGTGLFKLSDFSTQPYIKYKRNPDYWKKDNG